jgi:hypothetical protein
MAQPAPCAAVASRERALLSPGRWLAVVVARAVSRGSIAAAVAPVSLIAAPLADAAR